MERLKPKLLSTLKHYSRQQCEKDVVAGIVVAIIALPLSIALALASGVTPAMGIYTAIVAGLLVSLLGGSSVQIAGPTAAFATIVAGIVATQGIEGLVIATVMAGIMLVGMGLLGCGNLLKYIPYTITAGFTSGIAVTLIIGQLKDFAGLTYLLGEKPISTLEKVQALINNFSTVNGTAVAVGVLSLAIILAWPRVNKRIPGSFMAVVITALLVKLFNLEVNTIGGLFQITNQLPSFSFPWDKLSLGTVRALFSDAMTIAILAGIESLLSAVVADSMINTRQRSNMELIAQGVANIGSACLGGIPATGAIARTAANIKNGGRTPIAGIVHSLTLLLILVLFIPYAALIPMPTIAAILFQVAYNMCGWREFVHICQTSAKSDIIVLVLTFALTVIFDLVIAIECGIILSALLFMKRMSEVTTVQGWKYVDDDNDPDSITLRKVPKDTLVYEISGPMFFAAAEKILQINLDERYDYMILRMRSVNAIDATAMHNFETLYANCQQNHIQLIFSHVNKQPWELMEKAGFIDLVGRKYFAPHIDEALDLAEEFGEGLNKK
ncbi:MAG: SulP family inorganic anion transporter [Acidaminococcaceae bacterium]|nr:SulP family inorganic anion transporter [Acidaminococcaceae bacterium]